MWYCCVRLPCFAAWIAVKYNPLCKVVLFPKIFLLSGMLHNSVCCEKRCHCSDVIMSAMKTQIIGVTGLCEGNPPVIGGFPSQRTSKAENGPFDAIVMTGSVLCYWHLGREKIALISYIVQISTATKTNLWLHYHMLVYADCPFIHYSFNIWCMEAIHISTISIRVH